MVALVPLSGDVHVDGMLRPCRREAILIGNNATAAERRCLYNALLGIEWLPPKAHSAIRQELGSSSSWQKTRRWMRLQHRVDQVKARMRKEGLRRRGGIDQAAHEEIAAAERMEAAALKKGLQRFRVRGRLAIKEIAER